MVEENLQQVEVQAASLEEGKEIGSRELGVYPDQVEVEVLEEGKKAGLFGKPKPYRLRVFVKELTSKESALPEEAASPESQEPEGEEVELDELSAECGIYTFTSKGLYITVFPPIMGEKEVDFVPALEEVNRYGFHNPDLDALGDAVKKPGEKFRIGPTQPRKVLLRKSITVEEPKSSYFSYHFKNDGVYAVLHPVEERPVHLEKVIEELTVQGVAEVDTDALAVCAQSAPGEEVRIAPPQSEAVKKDFQVDIQISSDEMQATVSVTPPFGGKEAAKEDIQKAIADRGVAVEVENEQLDEVLESAKLFKTSLRLRGIRSTPGKDARVENLFGKKEKTELSEAEDGRVDYRELGIVENVTKGHALVQKIPPELGMPGKTVTGKDLPPSPGKDIQLKAGKGAKVTEDGMQIVAEIDGCPVIQEGKVSVLPVYQVPGNVDFSTGNIDFVGNVVIKGNVTSGFTVKAAGNIEISGNVEDAVVQAGGKVIIRGGVYGRGKGLVSAAEELQVGSVQNGNIRCKGVLKVGEALMHSQISAGKKIIVGGRKGLIVGGKIQAGEEVKCRTIGSYMATPTEIEVGINPELRDELKTLENQIHQDQDNLSKSQHAIESLKELQKQVGDLPQTKKELLLKLTRTQFQLMAQLKQGVAKKQQMEEQLGTQTQGKVAAADIIYPGVKISIKRGVLLINEEMKYVTLYEKNDEVKVGTFR